MGITFKEFNHETFEILEHGESPGFRKAFHVMICAAVSYFIYILANSF